MSFTSRDFPGRSFATKDEYEQAKQEKKSIEKSIRQPPDIEAELEDPWEEGESPPLDGQEHSVFSGRRQNGN